MLGLGQNIRGDVARRSARGQDQHFRRAGGHVNRAIIGNDALRGGDVAIAGAANFVHARNRLRAVGERADRLRAAHAGNFRHAENFRGCEQRGTRLRAGHDDALHAGHLRRDRRHQQRREKRKSPAGNVAADGSERRDALADANARLDRDGPRARTLLLRRRGGCFARRARSRAARSRGTLRLAARISARLIHSDFRVRRSPSRRSAQRNSAASPFFRTSARIASGNSLGSRVMRAAPREEFRGHAHPLV